MGISHQAPLPLLMRTKFNYHRFWANAQSPHFTSGETEAQRGRGLSEDPPQPSSAPSIGRLCFLSWCETLLRIS